MTRRDDLVSWLDALLAPEGACQDSSNNGLQVTGADEVKRIVFGVDACLGLFLEAVERDADFVVVHHGLSWGPGIRYFTGQIADRLRVLFANGTSLYASHLPLDAHPEVGNNAVIAAKMGLVSPRAFARYGGIEIGWEAELAEPETRTGFAERVNLTLGAAATVLPAGPETVRRVGVVSGGAADMVAECSERGIDTLVTGELGHMHVHPAREYGVNVIAAGHYRTEVFGVQALMERVRTGFPGIVCEFVELPTGQ
ncbi:MAG: Nif3-like dinuclear metal center hexameric protein [Lentisphaerae bacterium]|jgi:dinuclear metal center YbgI/SA1388 family protein|nr:Nif3-like dinuclear metal center hexameric protein [Lentisphaerota bacterium]MBT4816457.1 Nif3-like dinuclear metal center hexameric protein [Lentisphaerota bacterium]MBT5604406.1 Nif3-like dinuclear metal center hexameric protein [Lentisphaerota bacterium]MBT7059780.1 Nif3-like dinuclear metal center hexameric protein [Lentisphaerota bacterium]MBT7843904.1 Nif3-like dinuclear metal center hexameric protein [Lentisphaerota bacterium]